MNIEKAKLLVKKALPKFNRVVFLGEPKIEGNSIVYANHLAETKSLPIYYTCPEKVRNATKKYLHNRIRVIDERSWRGIWLRLTSKYVFFTHGHHRIENFKNNKIINLWHGVGHKRIGLLSRKKENIPADADFTIVTSNLTQRMFFEFFGGPLETNLITGYPRNDLLLKSQKRRDSIKKEIASLQDYDKILLWMPTLKIVEANKMVENPFQIPGFDIKTFNELLKNKNSVCLVKPHYLVGNISSFKGSSNIKIIDDEWIANTNMLLYEFLACTDILITDFSSVMIDYSLLDQPIICFSTDLEGFKESQGLYFEDIENWLPTKLLQNENDFFEHVRSLLKGEKDPYYEKRTKIRNLYFTYQDTKSCNRISENIFN